MNIYDFLSSFMSSFFLTISQSPILQFIFGFWFLLALFNREHRQKLADSIAFFLRMPLTYDEGASSEFKDALLTSTDNKNIPLYPRRWFEDAAKGLQERLVEPFKLIEDNILRIMGGVGQGLTWDSTLGGILLAGFIYADIIGGINIISLVPGLITWDVPVWLGEYSFTIVAGTILSVFVSSWMFSSTEKNNNTDNATENTSNTTKVKVAKFLLVSSLATIIGINLTKLPVFVNVFSSTAERYIDLTSGFFLHVMVMFNAALATFLLDTFGRKGLVLLALPILFPLFIIFWLFHFLLSLIAGLGPVTIDIVIRIVFVAMNIVAFYVIAPIDLGSNLFFKNSPPKQKEG